MANAPRIIYMPAVDLAVAGRSQGAWRPTANDGSERFGWRLIGANNRELGRSPVTYENLVEARQRADLVRRSAADLVGQLENDPALGTWGWRAALDGTFVAASGRRYQRQRECTYNLRQFVLALDSAVENLSPVSYPRVRVRRLSGSELPLEQRTQLRTYKPAAPR